MSIVVTQRPVITSPIFSNWNGISNPILYKFTRKDFNIISVGNSAGSLFITVNTNLTTISNPVVIGDTMWVVTDNGVYNALYTVVSVTNAANSVVTFQSNTYISAATTGYINLTKRRNYKLRVSVYALNLIGTIIVSPNKQGEIIADVSRVLWANIDSDITIDLTSGLDTYNETSSYRSFFIRYTEMWIGSSNLEVDDAADVQHCLYGGNQLVSPYGGNMVLYLMSGLERNSFLTTFERLTYWKGWPCLVSAIINIPGLNTILSDTVEFSTLGQRQNNVITYDINKIFNPTGDTIVCALYYVATPNFRVSNFLTINVKEPCDNGVMLMGRNSLGGLFTWLFEHSQDVSYVNESGKKAKRSILFAENLTLNEWTALHDFFTTGEIYKNNITELSNTVFSTSKRIGSQVYAVDINGNKTGVIVIPTQNTTSTRKEKHTFSIEIEYPEILST